jgi:hypothetical protein
MPDLSSEEAPLPSELSAFQPRSMRLPTLTPSLPCAKNPDRGSSWWHWRPGQHEQRLNDWQHSHMQVQDYGYDFDHPSSSGRGPLGMPLLVREDLSCRRQFGEVFLMEAILKPSLHLGLG